MAERQHLWFTCTKNFFSWCFFKKNFFHHSEYLLLFAWRRGRNNTSEVLPSKQNVVRSLKVFCSFSVIPCNTDKLLVSQHFHIFDQLEMLLLLGFVQRFPSAPSIISLKLYISIIKVIKSAFYVCMYALYILKHQSYICKQLENVPKL